MVQYRILCNTLRRGCVEAFWSGILSGVVSVLLDLDHVACGLLGLAPLDPLAREYGCRLLHHLFVPVGLALDGLVIACSIGCILYMVYHATRAIT